MTDDWIKVHSEMDLAFQNDKVSDAKEEELQRWLQNLCTGNVPNEKVRHREIIRGLTIQHIQMRRIIDRLDAESKKTQRLFLFVAIGSMLFTALGVAISVAIR